MKNGRSLRHLCWFTRKIRNLWILGEFGWGGFYKNLLFVKVQQTSFQIINTSSPNHREHVSAKIMFNQIFLRWKQKRNHGLVGYQPNFFIFYPKWINRRISQKWRRYMCVFEVLSSCNHCMMTLVRAFRASEVISYHRVLWYWAISCHRLFHWLVCFVS